jgi:hypothetical protein
MIGNPRKPLKHFYYNSDNKTKPLASSYLIELTGGYFVETAGIEPASGKRLTPGTTDIFAG